MHDPRVRVLDAKSGEEIRAVVDVDVAAGKVVRYVTDERGDLIRQEDRFQIVEEDRKVRLEPIARPVGEIEGDE